MRCTQFDWMHFDMLIDTWNFKRKCHAFCQTASLEHVFGILALSVPIDCCCENGGTPYLDKNGCCKCNCPDDTMGDSCETGERLFFSNKIELPFHIQSA